LRPHDFILPNYPSYDDMYEKPEGLWGYGTWVNGGHWSTCEARMMLAYYRLGRFDDARRSMQRLLTFADKFRLDNPLVKCGSDVYQPKQPINLTYDAFGPPAAFMRGLFEYLYRADGLALVPHIPTTITQLEQLDPVRFGSKKVFIGIKGNGPITGVTVNGRKWKSFDAESVFLPFKKTPKKARVDIFLGGAKGGRRDEVKIPQSAGPFPPLVVSGGFDETQLGRLADVMEFHSRIRDRGYGEIYEAAHAQLILDCAQAVAKRDGMRQEGKLRLLSEPSQTAADKLFFGTVTKLCDGLEATLNSYQNSKDAKQRKFFKLWQESVGQ